jgi:hypothetical protein
MKLNLKKFVKIYNKFILPLVSIISAVVLPIIAVISFIRNSRIFIWIGKIFKAYSFIFALLGSIIMSIPGISLVDFSNLVENSMSSYWMIIKTACGYIIVWLKMKIFGIGRCYCCSLKYPDIIM